MKPIRIAMWSGPRNISTTMMRSFSSHSDTYVTDEPFYAYYLKRSKVTHPGYKEILKSNTTNYDHIVNSLVNQIPDNKSVWYQKHMAHHLDPKDNLQWTNNLMNCLLIRNPKHVIASYVNKNHLHLLQYFLRYQNHVQMTCG